MSETTMLHVRVDERLKAEASSALEAMGLTLSEAVRVFLARVATERAIPFEVRVPNAASREAIAEVNAMTRARYKTSDELFHALKEGA